MRSSPRRSARTGSGPCPSAGPGATRDTIGDFGAGDRIDLRFLDDLGSVSGAGTLAFIGADAFTGTAGEVRFADGTLGVDADGDALAELEVELAGIAALSASDLLL